MAKTSEVLPLYKPANYVLVTVDIKSFLFHFKIKLKKNHARLLSSDLFKLLLFYSENNLQEDLFDQILIGKLEFPSPYWDNITDSAKVRIHCLTWKTVSDKPLERLYPVENAEQKIQNRLTCSSSCCAFLVSLIVLDESSGSADLLSCYCLSE